MRRRPRRTSEQRSIAIGMLHGGMQAKDVAAHFGVAASTISRLKGRFNETGRVQDRPRSGRPKKTSAADDRNIVVTSRRNRFMSAPKLTEQFHATSGIRVSTQTIRIASINVALMAGVPTKEVFLRPTTLVCV